MSGTVQDAMAIVTDLADAYPTHASEDGERLFCGLCSVSTTRAKLAPGQHSVHCLYRRANEWVAS